ncbi:hypothetical protein [Brevibacillus laterosporus]|uniref:hypothetical protein n=1 Tax=Brevibacillus laterosporus TaxID=1465 RepID=UPI003D235366
MNERMTKEQVIAKVTKLIKDADKAVIIERKIYELNRQLHEIEVRNRWAIYLNEEMSDIISEADLSHTLHEAHSLILYRDMRLDVINKEGVN